MINLNEAKNGDVYIDEDGAEWFYIGKDLSEEHILTNSVGAGINNIDWFNKEGLCNSSTGQLTHKKPTPRTWEVYIAEHPTFGVLYFKTFDQKEVNEGWKLLKHVTVTE